MITITVKKKPKYKIGDFVKQRFYRISGFRKIIKGPEDDKDNECYKYFIMVNKKLKVLYENEIIEVRNSKK